MIRTWLNDSGTVHDLWTVVLSRGLLKLLQGSQPRRPWRCPPGRPSVQRIGGSRNKISEKSLTSCATRQTRILTAQHRRQGICMGASAAVLACSPCNIVQNGTVTFACPLCTDAQSPPARRPTTWELREEGMVQYPVCYTPPTSSDHCWEPHLIWIVQAELI